MKQRFINHGLDNFHDINVLELLLYYCQPRRDTNPLAHELMARFGSLRGVFDAEIHELRAVDGIGESAAVLIKLVPQIYKRYMLSGLEESMQLNSAADAGRYIVPRFIGEKDEVVYLICLDNMNRVLTCRELSRGEVNNANVSVRRIVEIALGVKAASVIVVHNHPQGVAIPSREDEIATRQIMMALKLVGVQLADHIVVAEGDFTSMRDSGLLQT